MIVGRPANFPWLFGVAFLLAALLILSCREEHTVDPPAELVTTFFGISRTDETGRVTEPDSNDWMPLASAGMSFTDCAHPNPCKSGIGFVLQWRLMVADSVVITINDAPTHVLDTLLSRRLAAGNYADRVSMTGYQRAIYRVYVHIVRADSTYTTYGDVQVVN
jgi:hypothetical protein